MDEVGRCSFILLAGIVGEGFCCYRNGRMFPEQVFSEIPGKATVILRMADGKSVSLNKKQNNWISGERRDKDS